MSLAQNQKMSWGKLLLWIIEGAFVGFGAILPGVSGGALCAVFGMYRPLIETIADWKTGLKKYGFMLAVFVVGVGIGFVGLSGIVEMLLEKNTTLVTCAFVGFIAGTFPQLWRDAGEKGRAKKDVVALVIGFAAMLAVLYLLKSQSSVTIAPNTIGYIFCGVLWGLSFIVPGLSSSSLLLFFGLYQPMLAGIAGFDFAVLIPMGIGMAACVLLLSRAVNWAYQKSYALISHTVMGIIIATAVMILPAWEATVSGIAAYLVCIVGGAAASYGFTALCEKIDNR